MAGIAPAVNLIDMSRFKVAVVSARWHQEICDALVDGAHRALKESHVVIDPVIYVPGSFELPLAAQFALDAGADAAVVLGVVVRGETPHLIMSAKGSPMSSCTCHCLATSLWALEYSLSMMQNKQLHEVGLQEVKKIKALMPR